MNKTKGKLTQPTQGEQVMDYLNARGSLTQATAGSVLGISRLAAVIQKLKKRGINIRTDYVQGIRGRYAEYSLVTTTAQAA